MKSPSRYNETSVQRTDLASPLALRYIEIPLYTEANLIKHLEVQCTSVPIVLVSKNNSHTGKLRL